MKEPLHREELSRWKMTVQDSATADCVDFDLQQLRKRCGERSMNREEVVSEWVKLLLRRGLNCCV